MQFINKEVGRGYHRGCRAEMPDGSVKIIRLWPEMRDISLMLDCLAMMWAKAGKGRKPKEITVTASVEPREKPSLHPYGGAVDYRTKDWDHQFRKAVEQLLMLLRLKIDTDYHYIFEGEPIHLHIQYGRLEDAERRNLPFVRDTEKKT